MEEVQPKRCYYEIMGLENTCNQDQIKRVFKKLSLKYHPDKNRKDPEAAKKAFQEITEAYNCLSDEKERRWYDNNREKLLMNKKDMTREELELQSYGFDIFSFFESDCFEGFEDNEDGFYTQYRKCFENIDYEEERTYKFQTKLEDYKGLPSFGDSKTAIEQVKEFYDQWQNFGTLKNFAWADEHDTREGENRYEKRQMEQENERLRRKEKKKYIQTIKDLVAKVKQIDPRREELKELERIEQEKILQQREANKSDKQRKKEQQERERLEKQKKKEEEQHKKWLEQQEKLKKQQEELARKEAEKLAQKKQKKQDNKKKEEKEVKEFTQADFEALEKIIKDGGKLTKKQDKEYKKFKLQQQAQQEREKQAKIKEQKQKEQQEKAKLDAQKQQEIDQQDLQELENEKQNEQNAANKKKKKKKQKKKQYLRIRSTRKKRR